MTTKVSRVAADLAYYVVATVGPVSAAVSQFLLSLVLLRLLDSEAFGSFSFLLTASQFSLSMWGSLFCAPLPVIVNQDASLRQSMLRSLFTASSIAIVAAFALFLTFALAFGLTTTTAGIYAAYTVVAFLRWLARAHSYALGKPIRTMTSDIAYSATLLLGVGIALLGKKDTLEFAFTMLLVSMVAGLLPFGRSYFASQFVHISLREAVGYIQMWRRHSRWAFIGVLTAEATTNSHVYVVTFLYGPAGFAPIAASALLIRPLSVAINALTEYERARLGQQLAEGGVRLARTSLGLFRSALIVAWIVTAVGAAVLLGYAPRLVFSVQYDLFTLVAGAALWMAVMGVRLLRTPESVMMQGGGAFRPLALAGFASSVVSVMAVGILAVVGGPLWSLAGILIGETAVAFLIFQQCRRWQKSFDLTNGKGNAAEAA